MSFLSKMFGGGSHQKQFNLLMTNMPNLPLINASESALAYISNPDVYACVHEIATAVSGIRLQVVGSEGDFINEHPLQSLLDNPNPAIGGSKWRELLVSNLLITGSAFALRVGASDLSRPPRELYILNSLAVDVSADSSGNVEKYNYRSSNSLVTYPPEAVMRMEFFNPMSELKGLSPISAASAGIKIGDMARAWNYALLRQGARPAGALKVKTALSEQEHSRIKSELEQKFQGYNNAGRPMVLEGDADWINIGYSPAEMEYQSDIRLSTLDICRVFNIPPEMIGDSQNKTYSNYQEARKAFYHETVLPLMDWISDSMTHWIGGLYGDVKVYYDHNDIEALQEDRTAVFDRLLRAVGQGMMTINEARREIGLEPVRGGDNPLVAANVLPLDLVSGAPLNDEGL